jgi:adenine phosphoribosyltransferase
MMIEMLKAKIRDIPDFPQPGIVFKDITPLLGDAKAFSTTIDILRQRYHGLHVDYVVGVEARGLVLGAALANALGTGFVMVRKPGKLPAETLQATYQLEYGTDSLEIHLDAMKPGSQVVIIDDVLATGGTMTAVTQLVATLKAEIIEVAFLIELSFLDGRSQLKHHSLYSLIQY